MKPVKIGTVMLSSNLFVNSSTVLATTAIEMKRNGNAGKNR